MSDSIDEDLTVAELQSELVVMRRRLLRLEGDRDALSYEIHQRTNERNAAEALVLQRLRISLPDGKLPSDYEYMLSHSTSSTVFQVRGLEILRLLARADARFEEKLREVEAARLAELQPVTASVVT
jgi:hypothetical protein